MSDVSFILKQCRFERPDGLCTVIQTAWMPQKFCEVGKLITLKSEDHKNVWKVAEVFESEMKSEDVKHVRDQYRHHRKNTDV